MYVNFQIKYMYILKGMASFGKLLQQLFNNE